jgi:mono/diheme cytochrome c family protein
MKPLAKLWLGIGVGVVLLGLGSVTTVTAQDQGTPAAPQATPTIDRLAAPPTVAAPTQADEGAQLYWLWCQPCHGDRGQGLTDEWRAQYPKEDQYCWNNGCHGNLPYENGFTLPKHVPALIGDSSLLRFQTMAELSTYVDERMPFEYPGALNDEERLAVVAYLARAHDKWDGTTLTADNIDQFRWQPLPTATPVEPPAADSNVGVVTMPGGAYSSYWIVGALLAGTAALGGLALWQRQRR